MISAAYGKGPDRSYIAGCSNGGRHAMVAAARYPEHYDGFLAGAPGFNLPKSSLYSISKGQKYLTVATNPADLSTAFTSAERTTVANAVLARCDALDGAVDGLVQDTEACQARVRSPARRSDVHRRARRNLPERSAEVRRRFDLQGPHARRRHAGHDRASRGIRGSHPRPDLLALHLADGLECRQHGHRAEGSARESRRFDTRAFSLGADIEVLWAQINASNATYTESALSFMTPPNPTDLSRVARPRRQDDRLPRRQRPGVHGGRHHRLVRPLRDRNGGDAPTSPASSGCPACPIAASARRRTNSTRCLPWSPGSSRGRRPTRSSRLRAAPATRGRQQRSACRLGAEPDEAALPVPEGRTLQRLREPRRSSELQLPLSRHHRSGHCASKIH